jgi:stage II sporulation protein D
VIRALVFLIFAAGPGTFAAISSSTLPGARNSGPNPSASMQAIGSAATLIRAGLLRGKSYEVTTLPLEEYVSRVLAGEAARDSPDAALQALAIAIRTFAVANLGRHRAEGFNLCDQTHCQVLRASSAATERAAGATAGQVLMFDGAPASIFYSASCGGHTERPSAVWPGSVDLPYLPTRADDACGGHPEWTAELRAGDLQRVLALAGYKGRLRGIRVASRHESGRVDRLIVAGLTPNSLSGQDLRMAVARVPSLAQIQSAAFEVKLAGGQYRFTGHGYGHGVGLCVIGSVRLASSGVSARSILERYFPGTTLGSLNVSISSRPQH